MNACTTYSLFAVMAAATVLGAGSAFALDPPCPTCEGDPVELAEEARMKTVPLILSLDGESYDMGDTVTVSGHVSHIAAGYPITLVVRDSMSNVVTVDQLMVDEDGNFETMLSTGSWSAGIYQVSAHYRENTNTKVQFLLGDAMTMMPAPSAECGASALDIHGQCVDYEIEGGTVTGAMVNTYDSSIILDIEATDDGMVSLHFPAEVIEGIFLVLVDDEESDDVLVDGQTVTVWFLAGAEKVEILGSHVIPEFGTIAALVLAAAIVSIVAVSARSRLSIIPRF